MKVKKRKEEWQAEFYNGSGIPEDIKEEFHDYVEEHHEGWGVKGPKFLQVSRYNSDKREWEEWEVYPNHWLVWSNYGKIKVLDHETFEEKYEEDA